MSGKCFEVLCKHSLAIMGDARCLSVTGVASILAVMACIKLRLDISEQF